MKNIKIDGHVFENNYIEINSSDTKKPNAVAVESICINCGYKTPYTIHYISDCGIHLIILREDYLTCKTYMIKKLLE
jgi:hypothetical protein